MKKEEIIYIVKLFLAWRLLLFAFILVGMYIFPLQLNFLGGGLKNYLSSPLIWSWANFDGEHYLAIAQHGYGFAEQAFFPLYPLLMKFVGGLFGSSLLAFNLIGQLISNISFLFALFGFYKLVRLDYSEKVAIFTTILLLVFPTSFYFVSVYTESLFLALVIWSFYFAREDNWVVASVLGLFASATRVVGILLFPVLIIEFFIVRQAYKVRPLKLIWLWLLLIPLGLLIYMYYLKQTTGDWLAFLHSLPSFGEQRSANLVLLPRVFYRYFFRILPSLNYSYFPVVFTTLLETTVAILFLAVSIWSFLRLRLSYAIYLSLGYLVPTLSGSFSSLPRYVLVLFPAFIFISLYLNKLPKYLITILLAISVLLLVVASSLFLRGYWVS